MRPQLLSSLVLFKCTATSHLWSEDSVTLHTPSRTGHSLHWISELHKGFDIRRHRTLLTWIRCQPLALTLTISYNITLSKNTHLPHIPRRHIWCKESFSSLTEGVKSKQLIIIPVSRTCNSSPLTSGWDTGVCFSFSLGLEGRRRRAGMGDIGVHHD